MTLDTHLAQVLEAMRRFGVKSLATGTVAEARRTFRLYTVDLRRPEHVFAVAAVEEVERGRLYAPEGEPAGTVVFFHGGGHVIGDLDTHDNQARLLCRESGARVLSVPYRLAPEHRWPAAVEDALTGADWAVENLPGPFALAGDSAGGNLAAIVAQERRERFVAQLLVYPNVDARDDDGLYPSRVENGEGYYLTREDMRWFHDHYGGDPDDPRRSPILGDLAGLPGAVVVTAGYDPLRDEGDAYADALHAAGVEVVHMRESALIHGFFGLTAVSPAADAAARRACHALRELLERAPVGG